MGILTSMIMAPVVAPYAGPVIARQFIDYQNAAVDAFPAVYVTTRNNARAGYDLQLETALRQAAKQLDINPARIVVTRKPAIKGLLKPKFSTELKVQDIPRADIPAVFQAAASILNEGLTTAFAPYNPLAPQEYTSYAPQLRKRRLSALA